MKGYDILGNVALVKFSRGTKTEDKKIYARNLMSRHKQVSTVLEKINKFSGRLRTLRASYILGEKTKEILYKENGCVFRFNLEKCYFSPRLSAERLEIANMVKKGENVLVLFAGVAPFSIVISKNSGAKRIVSVELGRLCKKYAEENVRRNKCNNVEIVQGDVRRILPKMREKFDRIVMPRPNLKDSFLDVVFSRAKKSAIVHYYGFYDEDDSDKLIDLLNKEAKKARRKIKILRIKKAGDIAIRKYRYRVDFKILS